MGVFDVFCLACGGPCYARPGFNSTNWCNDWIVVTDRGAVNCAGYDGYGGFRNSDRVGDIVDAFKPDSSVNDIGGFGFHKVCWQIIGFPFYRQLIHIHREVFNNHAERHKYLLSFAFAQDYNFDKFTRENMWMLQNPLKNRRNFTRILREWKAIVNNR